MRKAKNNLPSDIIRTVAIINASTLATNAYVSEVVRALQAQVAEDFAPVWGFSADIHFSKKQTADATIYIVDNPQSPSDQGDLGFHDITDSEIPIGFAFIQTSINNRTSWESTV